MGYDWAQEEYDLLMEPVRKVRALLQDWYVVIEDGTVTQRMPDPFYEGKVTTEIADKVIAAMDEEFNKELSWASMKSADGGYTDGPGFHRLPDIQRMALVQQLEEVLRDVKDEELVRPPLVYAAQEVG